MPSLDTTITFRPDDDTFEAMKGLRDRVGVPFAEQIRRSLRFWLEHQGELKTPAPTRKRKSRKRT